MSLRKRDNTLGKPSILSLYLDSFHKFNYTGIRKLDSIYHVIKIILKSYFWRETLGFVVYCMCVWSYQQSFSYVETGLPGLNQY